MNKQDLHSNTSGYISNDNICSQDGDLKGFDDSEISKTMADSKAFATLHIREVKKVFAKLKRLSSIKKMKSMKYRKEMAKRTVKSGTEMMESNTEEVDTLDVESRTKDKFHQLVVVEVQKTNLEKAHQSSKLLRDFFYYKILFILISIPTIFFL